MKVACMPTHAGEFFWTAFTAKTVRSSAFSRLLKNPKGGFFKTVLPNPTNAVGGSFILSLQARLRRALE
jgi:hypothetical protein